MPLASTIVCAGCGSVARPDDPYPFRCPNAREGDDTDHVMTRVLDPTRVRFPEGEEPDPFLRYRELFHSYHLALANGLSDDDYVEIVERLDKEIAGVDGHGFTVTPFGRSDRLSDRLGFSATGGVWVKDETGNVSGSHKARHLMGLLIHLEVVERLGLDPAAARTPPPLAVASCGNAALAAAVVARAAGRRLDVFVPTTADPAIVAELERLQARPTICPREDGVSGDPTYARLKRAIGDGSLPFTCQGNLNGLAIEGGETLGYEMASELARAGRGLDRLFVQVGGGALASSTIQALREAADLGRLAVLPRVHAVQTRGAFPLRRAYDLLVERILRRLGRELAVPAPPGGEAEVADLLAAHASVSSPVVEEEFRRAATARSELMWPWEEEPRSVADGILDDETYDWLVIIRGMIATGGFPIVVSEETLIEANELARSVTEIDVDHTGSSGLAGLLDLSRRDGIRPEETVAVLFTGVRR